MVIPAPGRGPLPSAGPARLPAASPGCPGALLWGRGPPHASPGPGVCCLGLTRRERGSAALCRGTACRAEGPSLVGTGLLPASRL